VHLVVVAVPEEYSVERVRLRVAAGGHDVPEEKIRSRWQRLWDNVVAMIELADSAEVFDNSGPSPTTIATFVAGEIVGAPRWPNWTPEALAARWLLPNDPR
jgi:predicted ABC-type ATPase